MWKPSAGLFLLGLLASASQAASLFEYASQLPACSIPCIADLIPASNCHTFTNVSCICTDRALYQDLTQCVVESCIGIEAFHLAKIQAEACGFPIRDRQTTLFAFIGVEIFTLICVGLRMCSRYRAGRWCSDDYLMVVILLIYLPFTGIGEYVRITGFGVDMWTLKADAITLALKWFFIDESLYLVLLTLTKIVILCLYLQVFPCPTFRIMTFIFMGVVAATGVALLFAQIFQCLPLNYNWESWEGNFGPHRCVNVNILTTVAAVFAIVQDVAILLLPIKVLINLNASARKKAGIILMFSLGLFVTFVSCIRLRYVVKFMKSTNPTWDYTDLLLWSAVEINVAIIVPCLPAIRLLFIHRASPEASNTQDSISRVGWKPPPPSSRPIAQNRAAGRTNFPKSSLSMALSEIFFSRSPLSPKFPPNDESRSPLSPKFASGNETGSPLSPRFRFGPESRSPLSPRCHFGNESRSPLSPRFPFGNESRSPLSPRFQFGNESRSPLSPRFQFGNESRSPLSPWFHVENEKQIEMGLQPEYAAYGNPADQDEEKRSYWNSSAEYNSPAPHVPGTNGHISPSGIGMAQ